MEKFLLPAFKKHYPEGIEDYKSENFSFSMYASKYMNTIMAKLLNILDNPLLTLENEDVKR